MALAGYLKQSTAVDILLGPFVDDADGKTAETGLTIDVELSKNGQALANKHDDTAPVHDGGGDVDGYYNCELDATDTGTLGILTVVAHAAGALPVRQDYLVVTANWWDTMFSTDQLDVNVAAMADDVITAGKFDESTAFPLKSADTGATEVARTGADGDTLEDLSDEIATRSSHNAAAVWAVETRTLSSFGTLVADMWAALTSGLTAAGSIGKLLVDNINAAISSRSSHSAADVKTALEAEGSHLDLIKAVTDLIPDAGALTTIAANISTLLTRLSAARAGYLDELGAANLPADVDTLKSYCDILDDATNGLAALKTLIDALPTLAEMLAGTVEGDYTVVQVLRLMAAALLAKVSGGGTETVVFRDISDTKNRITTVMDEDGNRTAVTLDGE